MNPSLEDSPHSITTKRTDTSNEENQQSTENLNPDQTGLSQTGLSRAQKQFVLKFCRQLASVIQACEQSESAEIEVGRRLVGTHKVKVKLRSEREI